MSLIEEFREQSKRYKTLALECDDPEQRELFLELERGYRALAEVDRQLRTISVN